MTITEKVAYLKGLIEGLDIDKTTKEGKVLTALVDAVEDIALTVADNCDQIDAVDEDLGELEEYVYDTDEDYDGYGDEYDYDDDDKYEIECPGCHEPIYVDESAFDEGKHITCPNCGTEIESLTEEEEIDSDN